MRIAPQNWAWLFMNRLNSINLSKKSKHGLSPTMQIRYFRKNASFFHRNRSDKLTSEPGYNIPKAILFICKKWRMSVKELLLYVGEFAPKWMTNDKISEENVLRVPPVAFRQVASNLNFNWKNEHDWLAAVGDCYRRETVDLWKKIVLRYSWQDGLKYPSWLRSIWHSQLWYTTLHSPCKLRLSRETFGTMPQFLSSDAAYEYSYWHIQLTLMWEILLKIKANKCTVLTLESM